MRINKQKRPEAKVKGRQTKVDKGGRRLLTVGLPILLLFFVFTPQRPVQFICVFLILLILGSKAYSEYLAGRLRLVRRDRELRTFRYEWTGVELWVENTGRLPAFLLVAEDDSGGIAVFRGIKCLCTLGGRSRQLFRWEAYGSTRGVYSIGPASLRAADPLGLFPFVLIFDKDEESAKLFVYPAPAFAGLKSPGGIPLGNLVTSDPFNEDLTRPRSLREYTPGDESRRINWKASAKIAGSLGPLLVNEYESSQSYPMVLFLNVDTREYAVKNREQYVERVIEAGAALCLMAARERQVLGLILHTALGLGNESGTGGSSIQAEVISPAAFTLIPILERLAALKPFGESGKVQEPSDPVENSSAELMQSTARLLDKGKTLPFGTRLIYTGPSLREADYNALQTLRRRRLTLEFLVIDEKNLGFRVLRHSAPKYQMKERGYEIL